MESTEKNSKRLHKCMYAVLTMALLAVSLRETPASALFKARGVIGKGGHCEAKWERINAIRIESHSPVFNRGDFAGVMFCLGNDKIKSWSDLREDIKGIEGFFYLTSQQHTHVKPAFRFEYYTNHANKFLGPKYMDLPWKQAVYNDSNTAASFRVDAADRISKSEKLPIAEIRINRIVIGGREIQNVGPNAFLDCKVADWSILRTNDRATKCDLEMHPLKVDANGDKMFQNLNGDQS